jgi:hypothetical protein
MSLGTPLTIARHAFKSVVMPRGFVVDKKGIEDLPRRLKSISPFSHPSIIHNTIDGKLSYNILAKWPRDKNSPSGFLLSALSILFFFRISNPLTSNLSRLFQTILFYIYAPSILVFYFCNVSVSYAIPCFTDDSATGT